MNDDLMEKNKARNDGEVNEVLDHIHNILAPLKEDEWGEMTRIAERAGLSQKNVTDFTKYKAGNDPHFRTTYKILRGILGRKPIDLEGTKPIITIVGGIQEGVRRQRWKTCVSFVGLL